MLLSGKLVNTDTALHCNKCYILHVHTLLRVRGKAWERGYAYTVHVCVYAHFPTS